MERKRAVRVNFQQGLRSGIHTWPETYPLLPSPPYSRVCSVTYHTEYAPAFLPVRCKVEDRLDRFNNNHGAMTPSCRYWNLSYLIVDLEKDRRLFYEQSRSYTVYNTRKRKLLPDIMFRVSQVGNLSVCLELGLRCPQSCRADALTPTRAFVPLWNDLELEWLSPSGGGSTLPRRRPRNLSKPHPFYPSAPIATGKHF
ncbi:uncharacterized protein BO88DRAFT_429859 [Aspergillus vadensis CBS 113365]|uniref:Uncharacterized protein n=1 Tax=Aspergillus vadensis (strain CBS 113365 / IMI 142717 / IBT 24658) TaxID=1448311 RepID=A0A319AV53_ASPVC|nr:hypothetical protein BO88DRAFT_429859 [Aspergillus vadensis CBS 113365]PYH64256.1 hypothetical protein BO88DRAFT_429859 [Aspergillus vadensis CBS 113365]